MPIYVDAYRKMLTGASKCLQKFNFWQPPDVINAVMAVDSSSIHGPSPAHSELSATDGTHAGDMPLTGRATVARRFTGPMMGRTSHA